MTAFGDSREHRRAGYEARRSDMPGVADDAGLDLEPFMFRDDHRHGDLLPFLLGPLHAVAGILDAVEMNAPIGRARENIANVGDVPFAPSQRRAGRIQVANDLLVAHRRPTDPDPLHPVHLLDDQRFGRFDHEPLLGLGAAHLGNLRDVAKRRDRPVPEAGFRIAPHRIHRELGGLARLVLIEVRED
ncbi:MAG: hypothetical protein V4459_00940 [Pseudomonadota bacterium]